MIRRGRHFLQIPVPANPHDRNRRAMAAPTIEHRLGHGVDPAAVSGR